MSAVLPVLAAWLVGIVLLTVQQKKILEITHITGTIITFLLTLYYAITNGSSEGIWLHDALSRYFALIIGIIYLLAGIFSIRYLLPEYLHGKLNFVKLQRYYALLHAFAGTMLVSVTLNNLGLAWVAIELTTLSSALLVGFYNTKPSLEAAWKYIFLCSVGIAIALFGIIMTFYATENVLGNELAALNWTNLLQNAKLLDPRLLKLAFIFIMVGYGTKSGLAPMHAWLPDAHSQAPSPISAMLSGVLLNCALYGVLRFQTIVNTTLADTLYTSRFLIAFGLLSLFIALPFLLVQNDVKRLLAYSSIEHMGIITLAFGIGTKLAVYAALLHVLFHALAKSGMFFVVGDITNHWHTKKISKIKGVAKAYPVVGWGAFLAILALAGSPPFGLFRTEYLIILSAAQSGKWPLVILVLIALGAAFAGLLFHFSRMLLGVPRKKFSQEAYFQPLFVVLPIGILLVFGLWMPDFLDNAVNAAGAVLIGGLM